MFDDWKVTKDFHRFTGNSVDKLFLELFERQSLDNLSVIVIAFENFNKYFEQW